MNTLENLLFSDRWTIRLARHLLLVIGMIGLFSWIIHLRQEPGRSFSEDLIAVSVNAFFFFSYAYLTAYLLVPFLLKRNKFALFLLFFLAEGFALTYLKYVSSDFLFYDVIASRPLTEKATLDFTYLLVNTKDMTFVVAIFIIAKYAKDTRFKQMRLYDLHEQQSHAEIRFLRNQLDPHIIFNNLNNLYSLSLNNFEALPENMARFRRILNYYLNRGEQADIPLEEELRTIDDYIGLEKLRYGDRLHIDFSREEVPGGKQIVPFLLFSIVENCFEHGCADNSGNMWIRLELKGSREGIRFHASNSKPDNFVAGQSGNVESPGSISRTLATFYPGRHSLMIDNREHKYMVDLKLNI